MKTETVKIKLFKNYIVVVIFLLAFFLRALLVLTAPLPEFEDAASYSWSAWNLIQGNGYSQSKEHPYEPTAERGPTYPLFLAGIYLLFGRNYLIVRLVQALIGAITCLIFFVIAKMLFDRKIAIISSFIMAISPSLITYTNHVITEVMFTFLLAILAYTLIKTFKAQKNFLYAVAGILVGISVLCRPEMLFFPLAFLFVLIYLYWKRSKALLCFCVFLLAYMITIAPWVARNYLVFHKFIPITTSGGKILCSKSSPENLQDLLVRKKAGEKLSDSVVTNETLLRKSFHTILEDPRYFLKGICFRCFKLWKPRSFSESVNLNDSFHQYIAADSFWKLLIKSALLLLDTLTIVFGFLGIIITYNNWKKYIVPLLFILYPSVIYSLIHAISRYRVPYMPYIIMFAVVGALWFGNQFKNKGVKI